jgi:hypothetical protein
VPEISLIFSFDARLLAWNSQRFSVDLRTKSCSGLLCNRNSSGLNRFPNLRDRVVEVVSFCSSAVGPMMMVSNLVKIDLAHINDILTSSVDHGSCSIEGTGLVSEKRNTASRPV